MRACMLLVLIVAPACAAYSRPTPARGEPVRWQPFSYEAALASVPSDRHVLDYCIENWGDAGIAARRKVFEYVNARRVGASDRIVLLEAGMATAGLYPTGSYDYVLVIGDEQITGVERGKERRRRIAGTDLDRALSTLTPSDVRALRSDASRVAGASAAWCSFLTIQEKGAFGQFGYASTLVYYDTPEEKLLSAFEGRAATADAPAQRTPDGTDSVSL